MQDIVYKLVPNLQESKLNLDKVCTYCNLKNDIGNRLRGPSNFNIYCPFIGEARREREFYKSRGLACPKDFPPSIVEPEPAPVAADTKPVDTDYHRLDEQVNICLETKTGPMKPLKRKFIRCSSLATVNQMKKYVAKKLYNNLDRYKDVSQLFFNLVNLFFDSNWYNIILLIFAD